jgi:hypothetical protein
LLFPKSCLGQLDPNNQVGYIKAEGDELVVHVFEWVRPGEPPIVLYHLTPDLVYRRASTSSWFIGQHERLARERVLDHALSDAEIAALRPTIVGRN